MISSGLYATTYCLSEPEYSCSSGKNFFSLGALAPTKVGDQAQLHLRDVPYGNS